MVLGEADFMRILSQLSHCLLIAGVVPLSRPSSYLVKSSLTELCSHLSDWSESHLLISGCFFNSRQVIVPSRCHTHIFTREAIAHQPLIVVCHVRLLCLFHVNVLVQGVFDEFFRVLGEEAGFSKFGAGTYFFQKSDFIRIVVGDQRDLR